MTRAEVLIIGGGLAGAAAAIHLARAGRDVLLVERASQPQHKVCGEFLSAEALAYLNQLGVQPASLGAVPIERVRMLHGRRVREATLPFAAMSLTRRCLDEALLQAAETAGARVLRGVAAGRLERAGNEWRTETTHALAARSVFLASGKHDLNGTPRPQGAQHGLAGVKMYLRLQPEQGRALDGCVELVAYPGGYGGLQPVEDDLANLCCLVPVTMLRKDGNELWPRLATMLQQASPHLAARLEGAEPLLAKPLAVTPIPYGFVRQAAVAEGLWALGDQAAVIPSFTGDGMSIALHSAAVAARMYRQGASADTYQKHLHGTLHSQVRLATLLSRTLVRFPGSAMTAAALWPGLLPVVARKTRIATLDLGFES